ncbi:MAG: hypothetical protein U0271_32935 [Polyangiaceae bacterium]
MRRRLALLAPIVISACDPAPPTPPPGVPINPATEMKDDIFGDETKTAPPVTGDFTRLDRPTFNRMANRLDLPLYWAADTNKNGQPDVDEVASLVFFPTQGKWVDGGAFTSDFGTAYERMVAAQTEKPTGADAERQTKLIAELDDAASVLVWTKLRGQSSDATFVRHMLKVSQLVDKIYAIQTGSAKVASKVASDAASQSVFRRNGGPRCATPKFESDKTCTATPGVEPYVDVWPEALQKNDAFCKEIEKESDAIRDPFTVVRQKGDKLVAVKYSEAYASEMKAVAEELRAAAKDLAGSNEQALVTYLNEAATSFETNDWKPADEAWAKMNARNSRWYLRVGPDEVYWEPCSLKAGFHVSFARINTDSLALQDKLTPLQQEMEDSLAKLLGKSYKARKVTFHLPDFIDIVLNAGDSRDAIGATIGQSLPNWGPVANEGRGRTVAMTNLYEDPDSHAVRAKKAESILAPATMAKFVAEGGPGLLGTVLHEATHNLGPAHEYEVNGKKDDEVFGGELASMLEELKAQSGAYFYLWMLLDKGVITKTEVERSLVDSLVWSVNHISRGMYSNGRRKPYSQLAAIQLGFFMDEGAITWKADRKAANGSDAGSFEIDFKKMRDACVKLMKTVGKIKAEGDKEGALKLANKYVEKGSNVPFSIIEERMRRFPQPNFVYAIDW